jgi:hypothetical protein
VSDTERPSVSARTLAVYSAALAVLLVVVGFVAYRELLHYERRAVTHVPDGAGFAVRVDLEQLVLFEPIRRHLLALVERVSFSDEPASSAASGASGASAAATPAVGRLARLREQAGLNLGLDLRELVVASFDDGDAWIVAAGGIFPSGDLLDRVANVLAAEPGARLRRQGPLLLLGPGELALGRAADGVLVLGSSASAVERALIPSDAHTALGVGQQGAAAFALLPAWLERGASAAPGHVRGRLHYGDPFLLTLDLDGLAEPDPRQALQRWLHIDASTFGADWGGERAVLARAELSERSPAQTVVTTTWQHAEVDHACRSLAAWLEARASHLGHEAQ